MIYSADEVVLYKDGILEVIVNTPPGFPPDRVYVIVNILWDKSQMIYTDLPQEAFVIKYIEYLIYEATI